MGFFREFIGNQKKSELSKEEIEIGGKLSKEEGNIENYGKEIAKNKIILFIIPNEIYQDELLHIIKSVVNNYTKIFYLSLNKPAEKIMETLRENNIDTKKFLFVDAITKGVKENISDNNIVYISPAKNFEKFKIELDQILKKEKSGCLIFDSLSTMLIYQNESIVIRFTHDLVTKLIVAHASGEFICLEKDIDSDLVKDISMFADKVIDFGKKPELKHDDMNKKEIIIKLEKELNSIRQAYASKFISEESYLNAKKRIENALKKFNG